MEINSPILAPIIALAIWTMIMWLWMYATRIPAMSAAKVDFTPGVYINDDLKKLPVKVQWQADNYNHLHEAPTVFYAVALTLALIGAGDGINLTLAWAYVGLRVVHSLWQSTVNIVPIRFLIFVASTAVLIWMIVNAALIVF
ncbi:MAPEG family protein [Parasphingopyxis sp.]|uniref:MAPEG family protein n=1 Tax=Parasphingopyxis sp. TaxID=1920299 RepID=UPI00262634FA|nr:MAPEG family protein [Parasphingopyxis sp.]